MNNSYNKGAVGSNNTKNTEAQKMQEFIYSIGETLLLELEDVQNITYSKNDSSEMLLETTQGGKFKIVMSKVED